MSLLQPTGPSFTDSEEKSPSALVGAPAFMIGDAASPAPPKHAGLTAHEDARALVRLIQCSECSRPLRAPVTLPCGHSICRQCLPESYVRENVSYPATLNRQQGVRCPLLECGTEHPLEECNIDVTLTKVMDSVTNEIARQCLDVEETPTLLEEILPPIDEMLMEDEKEPEPARSAVLHGGRLLATFTFAGSGELRYGADVSYKSLSRNGDDYRELDNSVLDRLRDATHKELDCHVCYNMMLDPVTTSCGHTFCRICLARVLDHSSHCPVCRRTLPIPPSLNRQPSNARLVALLNGLCPELVAARAEAVALEERGTVGELDCPLFVCTLSFPAMPTFLHIFEPRYRLMIRRALEGNGQFGMLVYNRTQTPQGDLGVSRFMEYGTMLQILNVQMLPDGRSLIETRGVSRFKVKAYGQVDGYTVGRVERVEDVSLAEEERLESEEIGAADVGPLFGTPPPSPQAPDTLEAHMLRVDRLSTRQLLMIGVTFVEKMRAHSAPWLSRGILDAFGGPPDDPALFPYWFASILPIAEEEKYLLLKTTSVRQRLKIVVGWIRRIEGQRWWVFPLYFAGTVFMAPIFLGIRLTGLFLEYMLMSALWLIGIMGARV
ncbi:hypothetical protein H2201_001847 [Coniosporium apollinis]|uniref:RING-type domain-containing protein n=1 Tax=Coniosporium apollinis TaxID=61459 RepID=A0ABQ9P0A6_9PEZI|nr:hypothetical protein H2201_001847 [Coniosporium apollinis]